MTRFFIFSALALLFLKVCGAYYTNFSLYGDEAQYWLWSQNLDLGYYSKPPLLAWFLFGHIGLFGDSFFSLKMFPILIYFLISFAFYKLCLELGLSKNNSIVCSLSFLLIPAATLSSFLVSTDLLLLLFWVLSLTKILEIRKKDTLINFFLLGIFLGLAFLAKYAAVYFFLSLLILIFIDTKSLNTFTENKLKWLFFLLVFTIIILPNIYWNINNGWVTFSHTSDNINLKNININFKEPLIFLIAQILMIGPVLFVSFFFFFKFFSLDYENKLLLIFSLPVVVIVLIESFLVKANANWAAPALISLFILFFRTVIKKNQYLILVNYIANYVIAVFLFTSILVSSDIKIFDRIRGVDDFVSEVLKTAGDKDLVSTDRIIFSNISYITRNMPNKIYMPYISGEAITNHFQISSPLHKNKVDDFYLIGNKGDISYLINLYQSNLIREFDVPFNSENIKLYEIVFK
tara:strand:+ start:7817 stop:9202 length:1386 start_codon:yes stop_codon:yes gene_type:complete